MSLLFSYCCCGSTGECFFGHAATGDIGDDYGWCSHKFADELYLRIPRPAFETESVGIYTGDLCSCTALGDFSQYSTGTGANAIEVRYSHFEDNSRLYNWKHYNPATLVPECSNNCYGYVPDDANCCLDQTNSRPCQSEYLLPTQGAGYMSKGQRDQIQGLPLNKKVSFSFVKSTKDFGDGYRWWDNVADYETGAGEDRFTDYRWSSQSQSWTTSTRTLVHTMLMVVHKTKWWQRYFNSIHPNDCIPADCETGTVASCRTPEYWDFECAGFPIFTWEVFNATSITTLEKQQLFEDFGNGDPLDQSVMDRLVAEIGCEPQDHGRTAGEPIHRVLETSTGATSDHYAFAREGGWLSVCYQQDTAGKFPQWTTGYSNTCDFGGDDSCFTAAPIPQQTTCSASTFCAGTSPCDGAPAGCGILYTSCGLNNAPLGCAIDSAIGDCSGIWFAFNQYCNTLPDATYSNPYTCCVHNEAFLCVVPDGNSICDCSTLPQSGNLHPIPPNVSSSYRNGTSPSTPSCCGGLGTYYQSSGSILCDATSPNTRGCTGPEDGTFCVEIGT